MKWRAVGIILRRAAFWGLDWNQKEAVPRECFGKPLSDFLSVETKKPGSLSFPVGCHYRE